MTTTGTILILLSALCAGAALLYQRGDHVKGYGSTLGGEMTAASIWAAAAVLAGVGTGMILRWPWGVAVFVAVHAAGFKVRALLESRLMGRGKKDG